VQPRVLLVDWFLDLDHQFTPLEHLVGRIEQFSAWSGVLRILESGTLSCPLLDPNGVPVLSQGVNSRGYKAHTVLVVFDFLG
jgi:hypothetical protein